MELTANNVREIVEFCLYKKEENVEKGKIPKEAIAVEGVVNSFGFHPKRIDEKVEDIVSMLHELPVKFMQDEGGGWSFLNAFETKNGVHWGEHINIDELICLGIAIRKVKFSLPREMWKALPGGMPYFVVLNK